MAEKTGLGRRPIGVLSKIVNCFPINTRLPIPAFGGFLYFGSEETLGIVDIMLTVEVSRQKAVGVLHDLKLNSANEGCGSGITWKKHGGQQQTLRRLAVALAPSTPILFKQLSISIPSF
ncbi:hypothetical protein CIHG_03609 [Coccidioides immitis H538.4]|uniref:Uncharacterized protein n=3 Tax=Coccidioides immitis TaxID=5501 RepID=A0A0J8TUZ3_COCIT|nr:hypothetical protein CIRG_04796 [Coccidioides immitis RMSCC 2394]KMU77642.1 hypothetical protein CISG_01399 [Coccidioides immitis RMSCC 3703]KMU85568.1 hypothetical protein CIHG_03609 [Coccidioides immitis H538.4]